MPSRDESDADEGSEVNVDGGDFMCRSTERGGFLFAGDRARAKVTGGLVAKNVAVRRGGAVSAPETMGLQE